MEFDTHVRPGLTAVACRPRRSPGMSGQEIGDCFVFIRLWGQKQLSIVGSTVRLNDGHALPRIGGRIR